MPDVEESLPLKGNVTNYGTSEEESELNLSYVSHIEEAVANHKGRTLIENYMYPYIFV
jgi:hypothetical protein